MKAFLTYALICLLLVFAAGITTVDALFDGDVEYFNEKEGTPVYSSDGRTVYATDAPQENSLCEAVTLPAATSVEDVLYRAGAVEVFTEAVGDTLITYAYTPKLGSFGLIRGRPVNLTIIATPEKTVISHGVYQGCF